MVNEISPKSSNHNGLAGTGRTGERLPGYAPDLNPTEGIWQYLKYVELKNLCCHNLPEVHYELRKAVARLRHKTDVILSCIQHVHLGEKV